jgi:hypothetical protein
MSIGFFHLKRMAIVDERDQRKAGATECLRKRRPKENIASPELYEEGSTRVRQDRAESHLARKIGLRAAMREMSDDEEEKEISRFL